MEAFNFKTLSAKPQVGHTITIRLAGTEDIFPGQFVDLAGANISNPFQITDSSDWGFTPPSSELYDVYWTEGASTLVKSQSGGATAGSGGVGDMLAADYDSIINANTAKVSNIDHPLVEKAVPANALFTDTDTVYDDTAIQAEVDLNTAKVSNVDHPLVETAVPSGALFTDTDTVYDDTTIQAAVALNTAKVSNVDHPLVETAVPVGALFTDTDTVYDDTTIAAAVALNTAKVSNVDHPLVETAVPSGALFTDTDTVYDDTAIQAAVALNTAKTGITAQQITDIGTNKTHADSAHAPSDAQKNSDILKTEIETVLTGEISTHTHAGGGGGQTADIQAALDGAASPAAGNVFATLDDIAAAGGGDMIAATYDPIINANTAKVSNVDHPLVETAVPVGALFTDTVYDDTTIQAAVALNTAKVSNIAHPLVETAVPVGAEFTDTVYDDTAISAVVALNTAKVSNVDHPLVETAVPVGALFTDTVPSTPGEVGAEPANANIQIHVGSAHAPSDADNTAANETSHANVLTTAHTTTHPAPTNRDTRNQIAGAYLELSGGTMTGNIDSSGNHIISTTAYSPTNITSKFNVYASAGVEYGMALCNFGGDYATLIYGPNQAARRISFGKVNSGTTPTLHTHITEGAHFDLDDWSFNLTGNLITTGLIDGRDIASDGSALDSHIAHPLVETAVPVGAVFTDTVYDDTAISAAVALNTAKVSNVDHPLVETAVPVGAVFTDTTHAELHSIASHNDTTATGAELDELTNGSETTLHTHAGGGYDDSDVLKDADTVSPVTGVNKLMTQDDVAGLGGGDMLASTYDPIINANTAKVSNVDHPLVETAVPVGAEFTDTVYDDTAISAAVALNTAKVSNIAHPLVETAVPVGAEFTDTVYDDTAISAAVALNTAKETNIVHPLVEEAVPSGALFTDTVYDDTTISAAVALNTAKVSNVAHPLVETAVPVGAVFTDTTHAELHSIASHNDTTATGAELEELTNGSETTLHSHAGGGGQTANIQAALDGAASPAVGNVFATMNDVASAGGGDMIAATYDPIINANTAKTGITAQQAADIVTNNAKVSNVAHPLVETAVPSGALFTDTVYNDTAISAAVALNTAKVTNVTTNLSLAQDATTATIQSSDGTNATIPAASGTLAGVLTSAKLAEIDANTLKVSNVAHPLVETAVPSGALFTDTVYDDTTISAAVALNTAKVSNIAHPLVETAVPVGAVFTDTPTDISGKEDVGVAAGLMSTHETTHPAPTVRDARNQIAGSYEVGGAVATHETTHPAPTNRDTRNQVAGSYEVGGAVATHEAAHPAPTNRDTRNQIAGSYEATGVAQGIVDTHETTHPAPTNRDTRNQIAGSYEVGGAVSTHEATHPAPTNRDTRNQIAGSYEVGGAVTAHLVSHAPDDAQKNSNILKSEIEAVLTGELTSHSHAPQAAVMPKLIRSITIEDPTASEDIAVFFTPQAITITQIYAVCEGTTPSVTINPVHNPDRTAVGIAVLSAPTAITNTTTGQTLTAFNDATVPANSWVRILTTAQSGTWGSVTISFAYDVD